MSGYIFKLLVCEKNMFFLSFAQVYEWELLDQGQLGYKYL